MHTYLKNYALPDATDLLANLEFALKHDGINLEIIKALFTKIQKIEVVAYIQKQPRGIYSRKIWYLYEFLMQERLELEDCPRLKYVDLLDPEIYFTSQASKSPRHAINDNLLGNNRFCPVVRRTEKLEKYIALRLDDKAKIFLSKYDANLISRAFNYLYTKETMSSYQIEKEQPDKNRITRFIHLLQQASTIAALTKEKLIELQNVIVDPRFKDTDYRTDQNYVGETIGSSFQQKIHYISPKPEDLVDLMQGMLSSLDRMLASDIHPVIIAAAISFGFVFLHPFEDGNGRIHRFLVHYILTKKEFTPKDMIFPISSIMLQNMHAYDEVLESFSRPLLSVLTEYDLSDNGALTVKQASNSFYQYIDFTRMAEYLFACIEDALYKNIKPEIEFLVNYDKTKKAIREIIDMPDKQVDLLIKCVMQNNGKLSPQKRARFFALLTDNEINQLTTVIRETMNIEANQLL
jgi:hypothetical protein